MFHHFCYKLKRSLAINLGRERFIGVEGLGVGHSTIVDLVQDMLQERQGGGRVYTVRRLSARPLHRDADIGMKAQGRVVHTCTYTSIHVHVHVLGHDQVLFSVK